MRNFLTGIAALLALVAASVAGLALGAGSAAGSATGGQVLIAEVVDCGEITLTFENSTRWEFSADWRRPGDVGTPDEYSAIVAHEGPLLGQPLGNRYNVVPVPVGTSEFVIELDEDEDTDAVEYRLARGPEQRLFVDWNTSVVETDCEPNETTTTTATTTTMPPTSTTTVTSSDPPTSDVTTTTTTTTATIAPSVTWPTPRGVNYVDCDAVIAAGKAPIHAGTPGYALRLDLDRDGIGCELEERVRGVADVDLASTGTGGNVGAIVALGTLLLLGGATTIAVAVRRRRSADDAA